MCARGTESSLVGMLQAPGFSSVAHPYSKCSTHRDTWPPVVAAALQGGRHRRSLWCGVAEGQVTPPPAEDGRRAGQPRRAQPPAGNPVSPAAVPRVPRRLPDAGQGGAQAACHAADVVLLLFATDRSEALARVQSHWMPELRRLGVKAPVILVGTKSDRKQADQDLQQVGQPPERSRTLPCLRDVVTHI